MSLTSRGIRYFFFIADQVRDESVQLILRQRVGLHLRLARRLGLRRHRLGVNDPGADLVGRQLAAHVVQRSLGVAFARDGVTDRTLLFGVDLLASGLGILGSGRRRENETQNDHVCDSNHESSFTTISGDPFRLVRDCTPTSLRLGERGAAVCPGIRISPGFDRWPE